MKSLHTLATIALLAALGCDDHAEDTDVRYSARAIEDGLFFAPTDQDAEHHALLLDVSAEDPKTTKLELAGGAVTALPRPGSSGREVVVLTSGLEAVRTGKDKRAAVPSSLSVFGKAGLVLRKDLQGRYRNISLSPDGRYAIAFGSQAGLSVDNSAEVIDFMSPATPVFVDLSLDARAPTRFVFSPAGFKRKLAVAPQPNALQIIDLDFPQKGPISVTLSAQSSLTPEQLEFAGDRIFVRNQGSNQLVVLQVIDVPKGNHDWQPAPQQLFASTVVDDIAVIGEGDAQRLLALSNGLEVFDPAIGQTASIAGLSGFNHILQFRGSSPTDRNETARAMLYASGSRSSTQVAFLDLGDETAWTTRNVEVVELGDTVRALTPLVGRRLALAEHATERASVIDLQARAVRRLVLNEYAGTLLLDQDASEPQLWARGTGGELGRVNLLNFGRIELPFAFGDEVASDVGPSLLLVPSTTRRRIAVLQRSQAGRVTFVDADAPSSETAAESALEVLGIYLPELLN